MSLSLILNETELNQIVLDLAETYKVEKKAEKLKKDLRAALFHAATLDNSKGVLPRKTMRLPLGFLNKIGMQENHYLQSRHPGWRKVESRRINGAGVEDHTGLWIEFLLERDPAYLPYTIEAAGRGIRVTAGRTIQQKSPEMDQRSLQKDLPEVFDKIMKPVVVYEVDTDKLKDLITKQPELLPEIERHFAYPDPVAKLSPIKEVEDGPDAA